MLRQKLLVSKYDYPTDPWNKMKENIWLLLTDELTATFEWVHSPVLDPHGAGQNHSDSLLNSPAQDNQRPPMDLVPVKDVPIPWQL